MKTTRRIGKGLLGGSLCAAIVLGVMTLTAPRAEAGGLFRLLCGPSILWFCSGPGGPDVLFGGTVCEKLQFEQQTGLTCVPFTG